MNNYSSFHILSNDVSDFPLGIFKDGSDGWAFKDNSAKERLEFEARLSRAGIRPSVNREKYHWIIKIGEDVGSPDVGEHVRWLLAKLKSGRQLTDLEGLGYRYRMQYAWFGNGTGGGPFVNFDTAEMLLRNKINLQFGFYSFSE